MNVVKEITDAPGYGVDAEGNVYTKWQRGPVAGLRGWRTVLTNEWQPKELVRHHNGYLCVWLREYKELQKTTQLVHRLVLETFVGPCPEGMECRHLDGNSSNNSLTNLAWGTKLENEADKDRHGKRPRGAAWGTEKRFKSQCRGERHGVSRLTAEQVQAIRSDRENGLTYPQIATKHGVSATHACAIVKRKIWKHI